MAKINKTDLIRQTVECTGMKQKDVETAVNGFINVISKNIIIGNDVVISGLLRTTICSVGERTYHLNGGTSIVPAHKKVVAHVSKLLVKSMNLNS